MLKSQSPIKPLAPIEPELLNLSRTNFIVLVQTQTLSGPCILSERWRVRSCMKHIHSSRVHRCMYVCTYVCMYVSAYVRMNVRMYEWTNVCIRRMLGHIQTWYSTLIHSMTVCKSTTFMWRVGCYAWETSAGSVPDWWLNSGVWSLNQWFLGVGIDNLSFGFRI